MLIRGEKNMFVIQKSIADMIMKSRDLSKLKKVQVTDKNGKTRTVYKRTGEQPAEEKQKKPAEEKPVDTKKYSDMLDKVKNGPEENALFVRGKGMLNKKDAIAYLEEKTGKKTSAGSEAKESKVETKNTDNSPKTDNSESNYNQAENAQDVKMSHVQRWDGMIRNAAKSKDEAERTKVAEQIENEYQAIKKQRLSNDEADYVEFFHDKAKKWLNGGVPEDNVSAREMPSGYVASLPEKVQNQLKQALKDYNREQGMDRFESAEAIENVMDSKVSDLQDLWNENQEIKTILWNAKERNE